jgi:small subunit ribosomal protein S9
VIDETTDGTPEEEPTTPEEITEAVAEEIIEEAIAEEIVEEAIAEEIAEEIVAEAIAEEIVEEVIAEEIAEEIVAEAIAEELEEEEEATPRVKPAIPGADLEVDIVEEGADPFAGEGADGEDGDEDDLLDHGPITTTIELAADARYRATGKRKTAVARVTLKPGTDQYTINGKPVDLYFPRATLQRVLRQPLEVVALEEKVDVIAAIHGGGVAAQAGALRHGISRALLDADPNLRAELKRRGYLTRDSRVKERKKAGLKKARKRPQFSKR